MNSQEKMLKHAQLGNSVLWMFDQQIAWCEQLLADYEKKGVQERMKMEVRDALAELREQR